MEKKFAAAVNCMDGRVQLPVIHYLQNHTSAEYIDMITEPGPVQYLAKGSGDHYNSIVARVRVSLESHKSETLAITAHFDCAGNPLDEAAQRHQLEKAYTNLKRLLPENINLLCLWIDADFCVHSVEMKS